MDEEVISGPASQGCCLGNRNEFLSAQQSCCGGRGGTSARSSACTGHKPGAGDTALSRRVVSRQPERAGVTGCHTSDSDTAGTGAGLSPGGHAERSLPASASHVQAPGLVLPDPATPRRLLVRKRGRAPPPGKTAGLLVCATSGAPPRTSRPTATSTTSSP